jgi:preprotein translocase subunit SecG
MSKATAKRMTAVVLLLLCAVSLLLGQLWYHSKIVLQLVGNNLYTAPVRQDVRYLNALLFGNWVLILIIILALDRVWARKHRQEKNDPREPPRP